MMDKFNRKRTGSALLICVIVAAFITGLVALSASRIFGSSINTLAKFSADAAAQYYAAAQVEQFRNTDLVNIVAVNRQPVPGSDNLSQSISLRDENGMRYITLSVFHGNEAEPRSEYTVRKSLAALNQDARPVYQGTGSNTDGSMSQKAMTDTFLQKKDAVTRMPGKAIGSKAQGIYMDSSVVAGDNIFRLSQNNSSNNLGVITEVANGSSGTLKHIDYADKDTIMSDIRITDSNSSSNGFIKIGRNLVFAWKQANLDKQEAYHTIGKPYSFKTLYSGIFDVNTKDSPSKMTGAWASMRTRDTSDVYYIDSEDETVNLFWLGYTGEEELPALPLPMRSLSVADSPHQQVVVRVEDVYGTFYTLTNGQNGNFPEGSSFTVTVNPQEHYVAGKPNLTEGLVYGNTNINVSSATYKKYDFTVPETEHQTVIVTAIDAQTEETVIIKSGETKQVSYNSRWTADVIADEDFLAGEVTPSQGTVTGNIILTVSDPIFLGTGTYRFSYLRYAEGSFLTAHSATSLGHELPTELSLATVSNINYLNSTQDVEFDFTCPYSANKLAVYFSWSWHSDEDSHVEAVRFINLENGKELYANFKHVGYAICGSSNACSVIELTPGKKYRFRAHISGSYYKSRNYGIIMAYGTDYNQFEPDVRAD